MFEEVNLRNNVSAFIIPFELSINVIKEIIGSKWESNSFLLDNLEHGKSEIKSRMNKAKIPTNEKFLLLRFWYQVFLLFLP